MRHTLLEYVCERMMGPPAFRSGNRSFWSCPQHEDANPSFSTLPPAKGYKDRFRCFSCGFWGDEFDIIKEVHPGETFAQRKVRLAALKIDYKRDCPPDPVDRVSSSTIFSSGTGDLPEISVGCAMADWASIIRDLEDQGIVQDTALPILQACHAACVELEVPMEAFVEYWNGFDDSMAAMLKDHADECDDPLCGNECREARGLPLLTVRQRTVRQKREKAEKEARKERMRAAIAKSRSKNRKAGK